jgi:hypothetical protein
VFVGWQATNGKSWPDREVMEEEMEGHQTKWREIGSLSLIVLAHAHFPLSPVSPGTPRRVGFGLGSPVE